MRGSEGHFWPGLTTLKSARVRTPNLAGGQGGRDGLNRAPVETHLLMSGFRPLSGIALPEPGPGT
jgi:hypothetical protein